MTVTAWKPLTLSKCAAEYEQMSKWMVEYLYKFQGRGIKIDKINSIRAANPLILFNILRAVTR